MASLASSVARILRGIIDLRRQAGQSLRMAANQNPEQIARDAIDAQLRAAGWTVQSRDAIDSAWVKDRPFASMPPIPARRITCSLSMSVRSG